MTLPLYLTTRGHVDLCRVASALCPSTRPRS
ncbi:putative leader peptide [Streptosporangium sp. NPDC051022]